MNFNSYWFHLLKLQCILASYTMLFFKQLFNQMMQDVKYYEWEQMPNFIYMHKNINDDKLLHKDYRIITYYVYYILLMA